MSRAVRRLLSFLLLFSLPLAGGCFVFFKRTAADPVEAFVRSTGTAAAGDTRIERIILDFNNDGREDMAVSKTTNAGEDVRRWGIYLRGRNGTYIYAGSMLFNPPDICVEPLNRETSRVLTFYRKKNKVVLSDYLLTKEDVRLQESRTVTPEDAAAAAARASCNVFKEHVEFCTLSDYVRSRNCLWKRKRP